MPSSPSSLDLAARIERDPIFFAETFCKKDFYLPFASFQREIVGKFMASKYRVNVAFTPRGFGKTAIVSNLLTIVKAMFQGVRYIMLISQTMDKSMELLADIKDAIRQPEFIEMFGNIEGRPWGAKRARLYSKELGLDCRIDISSIGKQIRGAKAGGMRPELIILDDMEDDEDVENSKRVTKTERWVNKKVLPALRRDESIGKYGQVFWLATTIANDSAVERISGYDDTFVLRYSALVDSDQMAARLGIPFGQSIWPEKISTIELRKIRDDLIRRGHGSVWYNEYMNDPRGNDEIAFQERNNRWFSSEGDIMKGVETPLCMVIDAAYGDAPKSDNLAIDVGGFNWERKLYLWEAVEKRFSPTEFLDEVVRIFKKYEAVKRPITRLGVESTAYSYMEMILKERLWDKEHFDVSIRKLKHENMSKIDRIRKLIPLHEQHRLIIRDVFTNVASQMIRFPSMRGGIDALDGAAYLLTLCWVPDKGKEIERMPVDSVNRAIYERNRQNEREKKESPFSRSARAGAGIKRLGDSRRRHVT